MNLWNWLGCRRIGGVARCDRRVRLSRVASFAREFQVLCRIERGPLCGRPVLLPRAVLVAPAAFAGLLSFVSLWFGALFPVRLEAFRLGCVRSRRFVDGCCRTLTRAGRDTGQAQPECNSDSYFQGFTIHRLSPLTGKDVGAVENSTAFESTSLRSLSVEKSARARKAWRLTFCQFRRTSQLSN
jgi:hypothetical protein